MIQLNTNLAVIDNSGAKQVKCIKVLKGSSVGKLGDKIVVAVQRATPHKKIKAGDVGYSLIVRQKKQIKRKDGSSVHFYQNAAVMLNKKEALQGSRIFGPVPVELRRLKNMKILAIAQGTI
jgi:large subunit ribosomal protein L14